MPKVILKPTRGIKVGLKTTYLFDPDAITEYTNLAKDWAIKTDGKVQEEGIDIDYSSKYYATEAKTSETNAETSATNASTSETNASTYASNASTSANTATTQAEIATVKATTATTQATTSITQAGIATTQAGIATTQAGIATAQASIATTKANESSSSAIDALSSKNAAAISASNAAISAAKIPDTSIADAGKVPTVKADGIGYELRDVSDGTAIWGGITGNISAQTDLVNYVGEQAGKELVIDATGALASNVITFTTTTFLETGKVYEFDLDFNGTFASAGTDTMVITDGANTYKINNINHEDPSTSTMTKEMRQVATYNDGSGYRWHFRGKVKTGVIYEMDSINPLALARQYTMLMSNDEMLDVLSFGTYGDYTVPVGAKVICSDDNGYLVGHIYNWSGTAWQDTSWISASDVWDGASTQAQVNAAKQNLLVSGTNIKTVNSTSLLGSGNVAVQPTLVSGTNIKTVSGQSILGSGDIAVADGDLNSLSSIGETRLQGAQFTLNSCKLNSNGKADLLAYSSSTLSFNVTSTNKLTLTNKNQTRQISSLPSVSVTSLSNGTYTPFVKDDNTVELISDYIVSESAAGYSIVGSPTIVNGVASGFSATNYLISNQDWINFNTLEFKTKVMTGSTFQGDNIIAPLYDYYGLQIGMDYNGSIIFRIGNGSTWVINSISTNTLLVRTEYYIKCTYNGTAYTVSVSTDNGTWIDYNIVNTTAKPTGKILLGQGFTGSGVTQYYFRGSIDLNETYIKKNNTLYWTATKGFEGSVRLDNSALPLKLFKVVDGAEAAYDAVPMTGAEVTVARGVITTVEQPYLNVNGAKRELIDSYVNGTSWYRVWSDGWIEQGGRFIAPSSKNYSFTDVNLLKPMSTTDFSFNANCSGGASGWMYYNGVWLDSATATTLRIAHASGDGNTACNWRIAGY